MQEQFIFLNQVITQWLLDVRILFLFAFYNFFSVFDIQRTVHRDISL